MNLELRPSGAVIIMTVKIYFYIGTLVHLQLLLLHSTQMTNVHVLSGLQFICSSTELIRSKGNAVSSQGPRKPPNQY